MPSPLPYSALLLQAQAVIDGCQKRGWRLVTAESCTGGLIAGCLTAIPGASAVVMGGLVTYADSAKTALLGVPVPLLKRYGAVSAEVAAAMAEGALRAIPETDLAIAVTGIAGPGGATPDKPVGLVHLGLAHTAFPTRTAVHIFSGNRDEVRAAAIAQAFDLIMTSLT